MAIRFIVISVAMARNPNFMNNIDVPFAAVSIVSPEYPFYKISPTDYCKDVLYLRFHDERADGQVASFYEVEKVKPIDDDDARQIIEFTLKNKEHKNFLIHCEAGLSRSPAVALAMSEILNGNKDDPGQYIETLYNINHHNFDVKKKILDIYYKEYNKENINA